MALRFTTKGWEDYLYWQKTDKQILKRLNRLIQSAQRTPFEGEGKPEQLRGNLTGHWSRRISQEHRLVYVVDDSGIEVRSCRHHYTDR